MKHKRVGAFTVRLSCRASFKADFQAAVHVYCLDEIAIENITGWSPSEKDLGSLALEGVVHIEHHLSLDPIPHSSEYAGYQEFCFSSISFANASQMRPRWLSFYATVPGGYMLVVMMIPTIVMSNSKGQLGKAMQLLGAQRTSAASLDGATRMDINVFRTAIKKMTKECGSSRMLEECEYRHLEWMAGFSSAFTGGDENSGQLMCESVDSSAAYVAIEWLKDQLSLVSLCKSYYESSDPLIICPINVGRQEADQILKNTVSGTFLLRFAQKTGALALSVATSENQNVSHYQIPLAILGKHGLEHVVRVAGNGAAKRLLDIKTQKYYPRESVLEKKYLQIFEPNLRDFLQGPCHHPFWPNEGSQSQGLQEPWQQIGNRFMSGNVSGGAGSLGAASEISSSATPGARNGDLDPPIAMHIERAFTTPVPPMPNLDENVLRQQCRPIIGLPMPSNFINYA